MTHLCPDCGGAHEEPLPTVEEIAATEARAEVKSVEAAGESAVEVARVEGDTAVKLAKIEKSAIDAEREAFEAGLLARIEVLEAARLPEPEPEPVPVVMEPEPEPEPEVAPPPPAEPVTEPKGKARAGWQFGHG